MASEKITAIVESVKTMTVLELKELVDTICEEFGVSAVAAAPAGAEREDHQCREEKGYQLFHFVYLHFLIFRCPLPV